ncbi:Tat pathway signal sequence domain protein, partial [Mycobacterium parascrofulaceum ATCC BAA-614]
MMARMPDLSRRALLGLGAGAMGAYALDILFKPGPSQATPLSPAGTRAPL